MARDCVIEDWCQRSTSWQAKGATPGSGRGKTQEGQGGAGQSSKANLWHMQTPAQWMGMVLSWAPSNLPYPTTAPAAAVGMAPPAAGSQANRRILQRTCGPYQQASCEPIVADTQTALGKDRHLSWSWYYRAGVAGKGAAAGASSSGGFYGLPMPFRPVICM